MSTRDWKIGEVVYLKSGSPAMTVIGTDQHGATTVRWYDPQAMEAERSMYPTVVFPKDCLTETVTAQLQWEMGARMSPLLAEPIRVAAPQLSTEELRRLILETLNYVVLGITKPSGEQSQPSEKIVEATSRAAETARATEQQRPEQASAQPTAQSQRVPGHERQPEQPPRRKNS